ncbi:hypothetical protein ICW40_13565 [Actinotalea ferrariae]|uniref:hypothetical protein n=1 Tax=Actinotalea ferrariae TaxID=1386098 RepID=UPI001C8B1C13|nr:hypothetical protein [Actinotalea ferrariae]MBX9245831.1 hypothetical protein [Actinotalea ferrariae]
MDASVWAAWAGAAVSAAGAGIVLWVRWRDRPEVTWHFGLDGLAGSRATTAKFRKQGRDPYRLVRLTNVGDGAAYAVTVAGLTDSVDTSLFELDASDVRGFTTPPIAGRVAPNDYLLALTWVTPDQTEGDVGMRVEWTEGPVRHRRHRSQTLVLAGNPPGPQPAIAISARPDVAPGATPSPRTLPWRRRRQTGGD